MPPAPCYNVLIYQPPLFNVQLLMSGHPRDILRSVGHHHHGLQTGWWAEDVLVVVVVMSVTV